MKLTDKTDNEAANCINLVKIRISKNITSVFRKANSETFFIS
jgi:hypothetical protein